MKTYQFKTNINCSGCVANVTPHLDAVEEIRDWKVDTSHKDKILTVETETGDEEGIRKAVAGAGFKAEVIRPL